MVLRYIMRLETRGRDSGHYWVVSVMKLGSSRILYNKLYIFPAWKSNNREIIWIPSHWQRNIFRWHVLLPQWTTSRITLPQIKISQNQCNIHKIECIFKKWNLGQYFNVPVQIHATHSSLLVHNSFEWSYFKVRFIENRIWSTIKPFFLFRYLFNSSVFTPNIRDHITCEKYWWRNILYINNWYPLQEFCMIWSWYLANDMQFYLMAVFMLFLSVR